MKSSTVLRRSLLALAPAILLAGILLSRRAAPSAPLSPQPPEAPATRSVAPPRAAVGAMTKDADQKIRSRAELAAAARLRIHQHVRRGTLRWWRQSMHLQPPLPEDPEFWTLVENLKKDLG